MTKKPLTQRQQEILTFISDHIQSVGFPPTRNELSKHFGFRSPNAAESHLRALERKGSHPYCGGAIPVGITLTALAHSDLPPSNRLHILLPLDRAGGCWQSNPGTGKH